MTSEVITRFRQRRRERREALKMEGKTEEDVATIERYVDEFVDKVTRAHRAVVEYAKGRQGFSDSIKCPICGVDYSLRFIVHRDNGHIHAACSTKGCVSWME
jgi:hypothetical protein